MANERKKRDWFDLGAESFARARPVCTITPLTLARFASPPSRLRLWHRSSLLAEHVPPESLGGRELLLTCRSCNNSSGTKLDAHAKMKEDVQLALAGTLEHPHQVGRRSALWL